MLTITNDSNYLARVVRLGKPTKHPNADKLQIWNVDGYDVITDLSSKEGDIKIFFPVECQIHHEILSKMNMYADKELNEDKNITGYVSNTRRIKAVKLRGVISDGIVLPYNEVLNCFNIPASFYKHEQYEGMLFDTLDGHVICNKYEPITKEVRSGGGQGKPKGEKLSDILVPNQFNFHYSTSKLQDNLYKFINPDDVIVITDKWHGTSVVFSNVLTKRKLSWFETIKKFFGSNIPLQEYKKMYSSRTVIKHIEDKYHTENQGFYNTDIYGKVFNEVKDVLFEGYTIYGEIVGYQGDKLIQKGYDYGCKPGEHKFVVYRITSQEPSGLLEWSWNEIRDFCEEYGLETVPEVFYGTIKDFIKKESLDNANELFLEILKRTYLEGDCVFCKNKVPAEGICIRNESLNKIAYKLKSKKFLLGESVALDSGEEVVE